MENANQVRVVNHLVIDSGPLIALAQCGHLDVLLLPQIPVFVPDMVAYEVTRNLTKPGSQWLHDWITLHEGRALQVVSTSVLARYQLRQQTTPNIKSRNRGEIAAARVLQNCELATDQTGALIFDDGGVNTLPFLKRLPARSIIISLSEFIQGLETGGFIARAADITESFERRSGQRFYRRVARSSSGENVAEWSLAARQA